MWQRRRTTKLGQRRGMWELTDTFFAGGSTHLRVRHWGATGGEAHPDLRHWSFTGEATHLDFRHCSFTERATSGDFSELSSEASGTKQKNVHVPPGLAACAWTTLFLKNFNFWPTQFFVAQGSLRSWCEFVLVVVAETLPAGSLFVAGPGAKVCLRNTMLIVSQWPSEHEAFQTPIV